MRASRALPLFGFSSGVLTASVCRVSPLISPKDQQCPSYSISSSATTPSPFTYRIAAAFSGKGTSFNPKNDVYTFASDNPTHSAFHYKRKKSRPNSGQDAFFVTSVGGTGNVAFGIADGVGGWTDSGVDPADFAHGLCYYMSSRAAAVQDSKAAYLRPSTLLQEAYDDVAADDFVLAGGSTACIGVARTDGLLEVANLGDSGFVQLRPGRIHYSSEPQVHAFNTPYQLSLIPPAILARSRAFGGEPLHDYPSDAETTNHTVRHGDVLVFASDGVWDNLSPADVLRVVSHQMTGFRGWIEHDGTEAQKGEKKAEGLLSTASDLNALTQVGGIATKERSLQAALAVAVAGEAKLASLDTKRDGPFAKEVHRHFPGESYHGGKVDDISVVVAIVVAEDAT
jgi:protein phosphatase PTC7